MQKKKRKAAKPREISDLVTLFKDFRQAREENEKERLKERLKKIEEMCHEKAAISACKKSADWPWALEILEQRPSSTSCGTQEDTLGKNRKDMRMI